MYLTNLKSIMLRLESVNPMLDRILYKYVRGKDLSKFLMFLSLIYLLCFFAIVCICIKICPSQSNCTG